MKLFKSIDDRFEEIGLIKMNDDEYSVEYERKQPEGYIQSINIHHKKSGRHIVQSYDKNLFDEKKIGNTCVGLTSYELNLIYKKMKTKGWLSK